MNKQENAKLLISYLTVMPGECVEVEWTSTWETGDVPLDRPLAVDDVLEWGGTGDGPRGG
jgi:hypothetical protein